MSEILREFVSGMKSLQNPQTMLSEAVSNCGSRATNSCSWDYATQQLVQCGFT